MSITSFPSYTRLTSRKVRSSTLTSKTLTSFDKNPHKHEHYKLFLVDEVNEQDGKEQYPHKQEHHELSLVDEVDKHVG